MNLSTTDNVPYGNFKHGSLPRRKGGQFLNGLPGTLSCLGKDLGACTQQCTDAQAHRCVAVWRLSGKLAAWCANQKVGGVRCPPCGKKNAPKNLDNKKKKLGP